MIKQIKDSFLPLTFQANWVDIPSDQALEMWLLIKDDVFEYAEAKSEFDPNLNTLKSSDLSLPYIIRGSVCPIVALGPTVFCANIEVAFEARIYAVTALIESQRITCLLQQAPSVVYVALNSRFRMDIPNDDLVTFLKFYTASVGGAGGLFLPIETIDNLQKWIKPQQWDKLSKAIPKDVIKSAERDENDRDLYSICILRNEELCTTKIKIWDNGSVSMEEDELVFRLASKGFASPLAYCPDPIRYAYLQDKPDRISF